MRIGQLDVRLTFQHPSGALDELGQPVPGGMEDVATVWAAVRPMGSNERIAAAQAQSGQTHVVTTRWSAALAAATGAWSVRLGARTFDVIGLPRCPDEGRQWLVFDCAERVPQ